MADAPPPYSEPANALHATYPEKSLNEKFPSSIPKQDGSSHEQPVIGSHRFPQNFGFYHASGSMSDMIIALKGDDPNPLFYITTHNSFSSKPNVELHGSRNSSSPVIATADFPAFSNSIDIELMASDRNPAERARVSKNDFFSSGMSFSCVLPGGKRESFEWKRSSGPEVARLQGRSHGMKLARSSTGEIVAAWAQPGMSTRKKGKMAFLGNREALGEKFELMAVMCMIGIMEKARRNNNNSAVAGGISAGAGAGC